jgi:hypothetical protein
VRSAAFSGCGTYRYALWRDTGCLGGEGTALFVMLNPSTADAELDDPTIRRCVRFARDWGYARLAVGNLYALRSTDPAALAAADDPVGPDNDEWLSELASNAWTVILAWGAHPMAERRARDVRQLVEGRSGGTAQCLGQTKSLAPRHPLYVRASKRPEPFKRYVEAVSA